LVELGEDFVVGDVIVLCPRALEAPLEASEVVAELFGLGRGEVVGADLEDSFFEVWDGFVAFGVEGEDKLEAG
jgi:hypothetical protein